MTFADKLMEMVGAKTYTEAKQSAQEQKPPYLLSHMWTLV